MFSHIKSGLLNNLPMVVVALLVGSGFLATSVNYFSLPEVKVCDDSSAHHKTGKYIPYYAPCRK